MARRIRLDNLEVVASLVLATFCLIPLALAQNPVATDDMLHGIGSLEDATRTASRYETAPNTGVLIVEVFNEKSGTHLDRQAMIKLVNLSTQTATWQPTEESSQGAFTNLTYGNYEVEASAVGYLSFHQQVQIVPAIVQRKVDVVLHQDPSAVNLDVENSVASPKARKETKRAIQALKSGRLDYAQRRLDEAYKSSPSDPNVNFLLGYVYFQRKDFERSVNYLTTSIVANPQNTQALTLLGRAGLERKDYTAARSALERAILCDDANWMPHNLLANAYLHEKDYPRARDEAQAAIAKGKDAAGSAQLVLGEALLNLGNSKDGIRALQIFLQQSPQQPLAGQVRTLIANVEDGELANSSEASTQGPQRITGVDPLLALPAPKLSTKAWQPPGIDDVKVSVAPDIACPTQTVIDESGKRIEELVQDVARFAAIEDLYHQALDEYGNPVRTETRKYNYVASISEPEPGYLAVDEYRADKFSLDGYPDRIASTGFAGLALVFHPHVRGNFDMVCEGLGEWHGRATWMVHFQQRDDRPNRMHGYMVGNQIHAVKMKGRAWITSDKFQIVRIEAEMVSPMPEIQLLSEHQVVEYGPIPFPKKNISLWLPKSAEIYFDFRKHRYYRRHSFDHYMLYSVDTEDKMKEPVAKRNP
jgi:tetratricopeptide (TPR) repeat protein